MANQADDDKRNKYKGTNVQPLSFESHGCPSRHSRWFINRIAERLAELNACFIELNADLRLDELAIMTQRLYIYQRIPL
jgi:hypothetical protein